jgi:hypothetical protein
MGENHEHWGDAVQTVQVNVLALAVKALLATHPDPTHARNAMRDLFAQFQSAPEFLRLPQSMRDLSREMCSDLLASLPDKDQPDQ